MRSSFAKALVVTLACVPCLAPRPLRAGQGEQALHVLPRYAVRVAGADGASDRHGLGLAAHYGLGLDDFWNLHAGLRYLGFVDGAADPHLLSAQVGVSYAFDVTAWVPYVRLLAEFVTSGFDAGARLDGGLVVGVGVDYRPWQRFAIGADVHYEALFRDIRQFPALIEAGLRLSVFFD